MFSEEIATSPDHSGATHVTQDSVIPADALSFKWEAAIIGILRRAPENQLKMKKLRKKVCISKILYCDSGFRK